MIANHTELDPHRIDLFPITFAAQKQHPPSDLQFKRCDVDMYCTLKLGRKQNNADICKRIPLTPGDPLQEHSAVMYDIWWWWPCGCDGMICAVRMMRVRMVLYDDDDGVLDGCGWWCGCGGHSRRGGAVMESGSGDR
ncbi:hypothetical protein Tco_0040817 [Tanacetum coccineum]